jgi:hypothetical protein
MCDHTINRVGLSKNLLEYYNNNHDKGEGEIYFSCFLGALRGGSLILLASLDRTLTTLL